MSLARDGDARLREAALDGLFDLIARGEGPWVQVASASMSPYLEAGDEIRLGPLPRGGPYFGDCIAWRDRDTLVVHRFLFRRRGGLATKADEATRMDGPVAGDRVIGRVTARRRKGRILPFGRMAAWWAGLRSLCRLLTRWTSRGRA